MEWFNFAAAEVQRIKQALTFIQKNEVDINLLPPNIVIVKTENYFDECEQLAPYYSNLGLEHVQARLVFNPSPDGNQKILVNKEQISGLSYVPTIVTELVHLANLLRYNRDCGNIYRFTSEQGIQHYYYEFLLWTKFQAMKISTRAYALLSWHEINGAAPPKDGCYQFAHVELTSKGLLAGLEHLQQTQEIAVWREGFWDVLEELAFYFGRLAFYQQTAQPLAVDDKFPEAAIEEAIGIGPCLAFYKGMLQTKDYAGWLENRQGLRKTIIAMEDHGKKRSQPGA